MAEASHNIEFCITGIVSLALQVNCETDHDVFIEFSGHVNVFSINVFYGGWNAYDKPDFQCEFYLDKLTSDRFDRCAKIRTQLENLLNEKQGKIDKNA